MWQYLKPNRDLTIEFTLNIDDNLYGVVTVVTQPCHYICITFVVLSEPSTVLSGNVCSRVLHTL